MSQRQSERFGVIQLALRTRLPIQDWLAASWGGIKVDRARMAERLGKGRVGSAEPRGKGECERGCLEP